MQLDSQVRVASAALEGICKLTRQKLREYSPVKVFRASIVSALLDSILVLLLASARLYKCSRYSFTL